MVGGPEVRIPTVNHTTHLDVKLEDELTPRATRLINQWCYYDFINFNYEMIWPSASKK